MSYYQYSKKIIGISNNKKNDDFYKNFLKLFNKNVTKQFEYNI